MNLCDNPSATEYCRRGFYTILALAVGWELASSAWSGIRFAGKSSAEFGDGPRLDSFSEPAVAASVLQHTIRQLLGECILEHDRDQEAALMACLRSGATPKDLPGSSERARRLDARLRVRSSTVQALWELRATIQRLKTESNLSLLVVTSHKGWRAELLDLYLDVLADAPENPGVVHWAPLALTCARETRRSNEVEEALRRAALASTDMRTARGLRRALAEWGSAESQNLPTREGR